MTSKREIDYLSEDAPIQGQRFALVSIVGPHMNQKCDVWGLKVKGVTDTLDSAKSMCKRLIKADPEFDIFTVEVGKFFPLAVEPNQISDMEYQNEQLNLMMKSYLENRQSANEQWLDRKQKMMQDAIREGRNQQDQPEHPVAILQRSKLLEDRATQLREELEAVVSDLGITRELFEKHSSSEREHAEKLVNGEITVDLETDPTKIVERLQELDSSISELKTKMNSTNKEHSPAMFSRLETQLNGLSLQKESLKSRLLNKTAVNAFINENFSGESSLASLENNVSQVKTL
jgi:chromosome segregation ATPase